MRLPSNEPPINKPGFLELGVSPEMAPDKPTYVTIHFEKGVPTAVDGEKLDSVALIEKLNKLGGENGIGILDIVENRLVGMKSRGVYETPGGSILYAAHAKLEDDHPRQGDLALQGAGRPLSSRELVYNGQWYTPAARGAVRIRRLHAGDRYRRCKAEAVQGQHHHAASETSPYSLYSEDMATFNEDDCYDQADSAGFINLFGLPLKVRALNDQMLFAKTGEHFPSVDK